MKRTTTSTGKSAESAVAEMLSKKGYKILDQNWRTRLCEIDIVASKDNVVYFCEVKYRHTDSHGTGLEYITTRKQKQMVFAAESWVSEHDWTGDYQLLAASVSGDGQIELVEL